MSHTLVPEITETDIQEHWEVAKADVERDLRKPAFRRQVWDRARELKKQLESKDAGFSLLELLAVLAVLLILFAIAAPTLRDALSTVRELMAIVNQVVVH